MRKTEALTRELASVRENDAAARNLGVARERESAAQALDATQITGCEVKEISRRSDESECSRRFTREFVSVPEGCRARNPPRAASAMSHRRWRPSKSPMRSRRS